MIPDRKESARHDAAEAPSGDESRPTGSGDGRGAGTSTNGHAPGTGPGTDEDTILMMRARDGDRGAFESLFRRNGASLHRLAVRYVGDAHRAEEIVQEAFLRIYRRRKHWEPKARFSTFAYRVVVNLCLNDRRRGRFRALFGSLDEDPAWESGGGRAEYADPAMPTGEQATLGREAADRIRAAIASLPDAQRTAILLGKIEGLPYPEVADVLGTTPSAVKSLVFRAMRTLREEFADLLGDESDEQRL